MRASLPLLPVAFLGLVLVGAFVFVGSVFAVAAFFFVGATLRASVFGAAFATAFFGVVFVVAFFGAAFATGFFGLGFVVAAFLGADFLAAFSGAACFETAVSDAGCLGGGADGESSPDEARTVIVPGPGITVVSCCESQRTRSIDPTSAVTTPSRSGPLPDRRIR